MVEPFIYTDADFPPSLKCQTLSFLRVQWPEGFVGENRLRDWVTKADDHPIHVVLVESGILISHTNVVWKYLHHHGTCYKAYGLTGVFTYPAFRRQGYGSQIIAAGTAYIHASDADVAMLHCDYRLRGVYARHGWISLAQTTTWIGPREQPVAVDELLMMQFLSPLGQQHRAAFEAGPIYFGSDSPW